MIEGNKNIPNLFIFSSTNHINLIDEAILRRLGDRVDLTRLNKEDRELILASINK
jgi:SpoVK/Ycf46/Vps4 family AAA+-type ATPase